MPDLEMLLVILWLCPGLVAARSFYLVCPRKGRSVFAQIVDALVFELVVLAVWAGTVVLVSGLGMPTLPTGDALQAAPIAEVGRLSGHLALILALAVGVGLLWGSLWFHDVPLRLLRQLRVTRHSATRTATGHFAQRLPEYWLVHLASGLRVVGWPKSVSLEESGDLYLMNAAYRVRDPWLRRDVDVDIDGAGVLLTGKDEITRIELIGFAGAPNSEGDAAK